MTDGEHLHKAEVPGYDPNQPLASSPQELAEKLYMLMFGRRHPDSPWMKRRFQNWPEPDPETRKMAMEMRTLDPTYRPTADQERIDVQEADPEEVARLFPELGKPANEGNGDARPTQ